jgi:ABC-type nitrate/sulfonate/bicarbonate transport system substrate-binding protein
MPRNYIVKAAAALLLAGLTAYNVQAGTLTVRLAESLAPMSGLVFVAKQKGFFEKHDLDVAISNFTSGKQSLDTVIGGGADVATTAEAPITAAAMAKQQIAIIAKMESADLKTLASAASGIETTRDLKGKKLAFTAGTGGEVYTMRLLKSAGLAATDVTLVNLRPQDMVPAMVSGSIDAYSTREPNIANGKKILGASAVQLDTRGIYSETFAIVVLRQYLQKNPQILERFLAALIDAETWMRDNREEAVTLVAATIGMNRDELASVWSDYEFNVAIDKPLMDILQLHAQWRLDSGNHPPGAGMPDFSAFIASDSLKNIDPARVSLSAN